MIGLPPLDWGYLILAANTTVLLVTSVASLWLHRHRHLIRGVIRKLLRYL
jgi:hypothetical protein